MALRPLRPGSDLPHIGVVHAQMTLSGKEDQISVRRFPLIARGKVQTLIGVKAGPETESGLPGPWP
jgi:hypothetical protein